MDFNTAMRYVMVRAAAEVAASRAAVTRVEHLFLGLLKLAELTADDFAPGSHHKEQIDGDIRKVKALFSENKIDTSYTRALLRGLLQQESDNLAGNAEDEIARLLSKAAGAAEKENGDVITAAIVLNLLIAEPTDIIKSVCHMDAGKPPEAEKPQEKGGNQDIPEMSLAFLPELTRRIRQMRYTLLSNVHGQDHVVHAFAEGMFSSEVLAAADEKRKRPRAIFVFAGPPGVGKTFLAEQAAEALAIPYKRFDMSSYADHQQYMDLVGFAPSYKDAKPGTLTGFVKENPHSILLFDEIEKAHLNTIHLFLQILDAGSLNDKFLDTDVSFKDTIIIFTSNAGRSLYEGDKKQNAAGIPRKTLLNALETEKNPQTGQPFFPAAICSRMATGWPLMFSHLEAHDLEKISAGEFNRFCGLLEKQYGIKADADELVAATLLFSEGGQADARTLRAQTELFFKNEIFKLCRLFNESSFGSALSSLSNIHFKVETENLPEDVVPLFKNSEKVELLLFTDTVFAEQCRSMMPGYIIHNTRDSDEALKLAGERDIRLILLDINDPGNAGFDPDATRFRLDEPAKEKEGTMFAFDNVPMGAGTLHKGTRFFRDMRERLPEIPIYLLESSRFKIDSELEMSFVRAGARGKLHQPSRDFGVFADDISNICRQLYLQKAAARLSVERKVLYYETVPLFSKDKRTVTIRLRDLSLKRALSADDSGEVLDDVEKPKVCFEDVIGAGDAKEELMFFINYLKNPKKFSAQGLKPPKGVLLYGPPGTGKTLLAKAMAGESDVAFIPAVASAFVTKYQGSGPESVRALFKRARRYAPVIIFIDEIDAVGRARGDSNSSHGEEMALNALLTEMDGFSVDPKRPVFVLAATNFEVEEGRGGMGTIDAALARRFDRKIRVDLPNKADRGKYITMMLKKRKGCEVTRGMIERLAGRSTGMSLANLESVIETASRMAAKKSSALTDEILEEAFELSRHGEKKDWGYEYLERVARHESGHAFMCFMAGSTPSYLTIVARGDHGGYMEHANDEGSPLKTREELLGRIRTSLGGRAAEIAYYGEKDGISSGASGDLQSATQIARAMICSYGMDEVFGPAVLSDEEATRGPLAAKITERISQIVREELDISIKIISESKVRIDKLVSRLMEKNKLTREEIEEALKA
ncbi:MAG: AAA family ATPase [Bacillota bacterium]|nr:AAA family ATPase [Bacillota bacterium]